MRHCFAVMLGLLALSAVSAGADGLQGWTQPGLVKVMRQDPPASEGELRLQAARGETEWGQIVLRASQTRQVRLRRPVLRDQRGRTLRPSSVTFHPAVYVHVSLPSGNAVKRPDYWPEVLPVAGTATVCADVNQPVYVELRVPPDATPGTYRGAIVCQSGKARLRVPVRLTVWPLTLPAIPTTRTSYYLWWEGLQKRFALKPDTPQWHTVMDRFFWFLVDHRLCPMSLPVDIHQGAPYLRDPRVNGVRLPYAGTDAELRETIAFVKRQGWLDRCFYYLYDEPPKSLWPEVWAAANRLHGLDPLTPTLDTIQPDSTLQGAVSIWCPNVESVCLSDEAIARARRRGEEVWWYTCCVPKHPYPTFLLDDDAIAPRLLFWSQPRYDLTGSLYINTIHWGPAGHDVWQEAAVSPELLANDDGLLLYSNDRGSGKPRPQDAVPVTGVRLEMIRDGLEDVELCNLLRAEIIRAARALGRPEPAALAQQHLAALASLIMPDLRHCDRDPQRLLALRRRVADETMRLQRDPRALEQLLRLQPRTIAEPVEPVADDKFAVATPGTPVVDGCLDDPVWERCSRENGPGCRTTITRFRNLTGRLWPCEQTLVRWVYDQDNLYCGFTCSEPDLAKPRPPAAGPGGSDRVGVAVVIGGEQQWLMVTPDGKQLEGDVASPQPAAKPWWQARAQLAGDGYSVELALPRSRLGSGPLCFNLFRYAAPGDETLYFTGRYSSKQNPFQWGLLQLQPASEIRPLQ